MTRFELVKQVLDTLWTTIDEDTDDKKIDAVRTAQNILSKKYNNIRAISDIDYSNPATQVAYIYTYTAAHADILYQVLCESNIVDSFIDKKAVKLTSFGGCPGSDLLGFMKFLENKNFEGIDFIHNSCDKDGDWSFCWPGVVNECSKNNNIYHSISTVFHNIDITNTQQIKRINQFLTSDIFTFLYFISEIISRSEAAKKNLSYILDNISQGSIVVFIDNKMDDVISYFKELLGDKYEIIIDNNSDMRLSIDEEKRALAEYRTKFDREPRLTANAHYCVARKL